MLGSRRGESVSDTQVGNGPCDQGARWSLPRTGRRRAAGGGAARKLTAVAASVRPFLLDVRRRESAELSLRWSVLARTRAGARVPSSAARSMPRRQGQLPHQASLGAGRMESGSQSGGQEAGSRVGQRERRRASRVGLAAAPAREAANGARGGAAGARARGKQQRRASAAGAGARVCRTGGQGRQRKEEETEAEGWGAGRCVGGGGYLDVRWTSTYELLKEKDVR